MTMKNDNEKPKHNSLTAKEFFSQFSKENLLKIKVLTDVIRSELEITKKCTHKEKEDYRSELEGILDEECIVCDFENSDYVLRLNFGRIPLNLTPDEFIKLLHKVGNAFRFLDPTTTQDSPPSKDYYNVGITTKENFDFFYKQLNQFIASQGIENTTEFIGNNIIFEGKKCPISPDTLESEFCRAMYSRGKKDEPVEWHDIVEFIENERPPKQESHQIQWTMDLERYHSAMRRVNDKVRKCFGIDELFSYKKRYFARKL